MKKNIIDRIPIELLKRLAEKKGFIFEGKESAQEIFDYLLAFYRRGVDEVSRIAEKADETIKKVRSFFSIPTEEPSQVGGEKEDSKLPFSKQEQSPVGEIPFPTETMAKIYLQQSLYEEAAAIYKKLIERDPENERYKQSLKELTEKAKAAKQEGRGMEKEHKESPQVELGERKFMEKNGEKRMVSTHITTPQPYFLLDYEEPPLEHGRDRAILMVVDPHNLYACWEITGATFKNGKQQAGQNSLFVMRIFEVGLKDGKFVQDKFEDIRINDRIGEYFIHNVRDDCFFMIAVGFLRDGQFRSLAHSKIVCTPPEKESEEIVEERWLQVSQKSLLWRTRQILPIEIDRELELSSRGGAPLEMHSIHKGIRKMLVPFQEEKEIEEILRCRVDLGDYEPVTGGSSYRR